MIAIDNNTQMRRGKDLLRQHYALHDHAHSTSAHNQGNV